MGFARIEGGPEHFRGININGGKNAEHMASFPKKGKTSGLIFDHGVLYANINLQDGAWPNVNHVIAWSTNNAADWTRCDWVFPKGVGNFQPARFLNFGRDDAGVPARMTNYLYLCGMKQLPRRSGSNSLFLARVPTDNVRDAHAYQYFGGVDVSGKPSWQSNFSEAQAIFSDASGIGLGGIGYNPHLKIFLLTTFHVGPGQLGIFESPDPWGPWRTVAYCEDWGGMGKEGEGLTCEFPQKWMSADGRNMWAIFSVYGEGAKRGINAHDRFNLIKVTLENPK
jgi:hypothetical protein